jgi:4'-phosphopantetheinyl transferase EntD
MFWVRWLQLGGWPITIVGVSATMERLMDDRRRAAVLSPLEAETYRTLHSEKRRREWLAGRLAAKLALRRWCRACGMAPPPLDGLAIHGRDGATGPPVSPIGGSVSISHSHDFATAVAGSVPVGVDIERLRPFSASVRAMFLGEAERVWLSRAETERPYLPTLGWAFKEAFCKARGIGLLDDLPGPEWQGWDSDGRLRWRWPEGAQSACDSHRPDNWAAYGRVVNGYALAVVGARPGNAKEAT